MGGNEYESGERPRCTELNHTQRSGRAHYTSSHTIDHSLPPPPGASSARRRGKSAEFCLPKLCSTCCVISSTRLRWPSLPNRPSRQSCAALPSSTRATSASQGRRLRTAAARTCQTVGLAPRAAARPPASVRTRAPVPLLHAASALTGLHHVVPAKKDGGGKQPTDRCVCCKQR